MDDPTYILQNREANDGFVPSGLVAVGNHELCHSAVLDDVDQDDGFGRGVVGIRLAGRGWSGHYCGACWITSDFEEIRCAFPARGKDLLAQAV